MAFLFPKKERERERESASSLLVLFFLRAYSVVLLFCVRQMSIRNRADDKLTDDDGHRDKRQRTENGSESLGWISSAAVAFGPFPQIAGLVMGYAVSEREFALLMFFIAALPDRSRLRLIGADHIGNMELRHEFDNMLTLSMRKGPSPALVWIMNAVNNSAYFQSVRNIDDVDGDCPYTNMPLRKAVASGYIETVEYVLSNFYGERAMNEEESMTVLREAAHYGVQPIYTRLINSPAVKKTLSAEQWFRIGAACRSFEMAKLVLADVRKIQPQILIPNERPNTGVTLLRVAKTKQQFEWSRRELGFDGKWHPVELETLIKHVESKEVLELFGPDFGSDIPAYIIKHKVIWTWIIANKSCEDLEWLISILRDHIFLLDVVVADLCITHAVRCNRKCIHCPFIWRLCNNVRIMPGIISVKRLNDLCTEQGLCLFVHDNVHPVAAVMVYALTWALNRPAVRDRLVAHAEQCVRSPVAFPGLSAQVAYQRTLDRRVWRFIVQCEDRMRGIPLSMTHEEIESVVAHCLKAARQETGAYNGFHLCLILAVVARMDRSAVLLEEIWEKYIRDDTRMVDCIIFHSEVFPSQNIHVFGLGLVLAELIDNDRVFNSKIFAQMRWGKFDHKVLDAVALLMLRGDFDVIPPRHNDKINVILTRSDRFKWIASSIINCKTEVARKRAIDRLVNQWDSLTDMRSFVEETRYFVMENRLDLMIEMVDAVRNRNKRLRLIFFLANSDDARVHESLATYLGL